ncbi:fibronectin type III domain-containing protein [Bacteroidota bacterium]
MKILQSLKEEMFLHYSNSIRFILILFLFQACDRDDVTQPVDDGLPPVTPVNLSVFRERDGEAGIEWRRINTPELKVYRIYRSENNPADPVLIDSTIDNYYIDYSLDYDTVYYYFISAVDIFNRESPLSAPVNAEPLNVYPPDTPFLIEINGRNWEGRQSVHLFWQPVQDSDLDMYEIYRDTIPDFNADSSNIAGRTTTNEFDDYADLELLIEYYYNIVAVDKGGLKSAEGPTVSDIILNTPLQIFPANEMSVAPFSEFEIKTVSEPAYYKIVIQSNQFYGIIRELNFQSEAVDSVISVEFSSTQLTSNKKYYWRIFTFTQNYRDPNSFSDLYSFSISSEF